jgi:hypothetical protein
VQIVAILTAALDKVPQRCGCRSCWLLQLGAVHWCARTASACTHACALPCRLAPARRLFEASALQLCARSVASSSGDVRTALKACRLALTALPPVAASGDGTGGCVQAPATVTVRLMAGALTKLAGEGSSLLASGAV